MAERWAGPHGVLLAAGAGTRMGMPKALVRDDDGVAWLARGVRALADGGCAGVTVVLGAAADQAGTLLDGPDGPDGPDGLDGLGVEVVVAADWAAGMSASMRAGIGAAGAARAAAAVVSLVDLPDVSAVVVARVLERPVGPPTLRRATYHGRVGHPVVIGRDHWPELLAEMAGDAGARGYLAAREVELVECGDLATGIDVDERPTAQPDHGPTPG